MSDELENIENISGVDESENYEGAPEDFTGLDKKSGQKPGWLDRKKVLTVLAAGFAGTILFGVIFSNIGGRSDQAGGEANSGFAAMRPGDLFQRELNEAARRMAREAEAARTAELEEEAHTQETPSNDLMITQVWLNEELARRSPPPPSPPPPAPTRVAPPPVQAPPPAQAQAPPPPVTHYSSSLVPVIAGRFSNGQQQVQFQTNPFTGQQAEDVWFQAGAVAQQQFSGSFIPANTIWTGTIIPAVLVTAINTDMPGHVIARVTQNIFDSQTGRSLLIPQGTLLFADYNSSVSFRQRRVQIAWNILIRPDGFQVDLGGMGGVDSAGMAGLPAAHHENWFEYLKAAGLIAMFSIANSRMAEETARFGSNDMAAGVAAGNANFINQIGGSIVQRAMDISPTLTVDSGEVVNVMINRNLALPPLDGFPVTQRYSLR